jgi:nucleoid-associated protein YgaU
MSLNLDKLSITPFAHKQDRFERLPAIAVQFNPESYAISKTVNWGSPTRSDGSSVATQRGFNAPMVAFGGGSSRQLSLELFFDTSIPIQQGSQVIVEDVRDYTNKIVTLTRIERDEDHPRVCELAWGEAPVGSDFPFTGVITSLTQRFTQFTREGKPVRAYLSVTVLEFLDPKLDKLRTDPEMTTRIVRGGDTLSQIAANVYHDPRRWREIAEANSIDNPLAIPVGQTLTIP